MPKRSYASNFYLKKKKSRKSIHLSWQDANFLNNLTRLKSRSHLQLKKPGKEEGAAEAVDQLLNLAGPHRDKPLVAPFLPVLLLEHNARDASGLPLLRSDALAGFRSGHPEDDLGVPGIRLRVAGEVREQGGGRRRRRGVVEGDSGGRLGEWASGEGGAAEEVAVDPHRRRQSEGAAGETSVGFWDETIFATPGGMIAP